jgi:hypothetical protein
MNRQQATIYLATLCVCDGTRRECPRGCRPCIEFRADRELAGRARCIARTKIGRSVRAGIYNGARASWESELSLDDRSRAALMHGRPLDRRAQ